MRHRPIPVVLMQCKMDVSADLGGMRCGISMRCKSIALPLIALFDGGMTTDRPVFPANVVSIQVTDAQSIAKRPLWVSDWSLLTRAVESCRWKHVLYTPPVPDFYFDVSGLGGERLRLSQVGPILLGENDHGLAECRLPERTAFQPLRAVLKAMRWPL